MKRILIVDDEQLIRYALSAAFRQDDTYVKPVSCGKDALAEIDHIYYNLCFLDINLSDMNGLDIMKTIKKISPSTKIIIMTGGEVDAEMLKSIQENADLLMAKPFDLDRIKGFVEHILGHGTPAFQGEDQGYDGIDRESFVNWMMDDKRQHERRTTMQSTTCSLVSSDGGQEETCFMASILDISDSGIGIRTDYLLKPGHLLKFSDGPPARDTGVVRWSTSAGTEDSYRAGIQFVIPQNAPHLSLYDA